MKHKPPTVVHSTVILANDPIVPNVVVEKNKYACMQCTKSFKRPAELKRHMNTHSGEKIIRLYSSRKLLKFKITIGMCQK